MLAHRRAVDGQIGIDGIAVTTPIQTFIDVGLEVDPCWHLAIGDAMVARGLLTADGLRAGLTDRPGRRGILAATCTAALVRAGSESPMESLLIWAIVADGLPEPLINGRVMDADGGWLARVDLSYPEPRIAIEYQGDQHRSDQRQ